MAGRNVCRMTTVGDDLTREGKGDWKGNLKTVGNWNQISAKEKLVIFITLVLFLGILESYFLSGLCPFVVLLCFQLE